MRTKSVTKWWWPWDLEGMEKWLEEMEAKGWFLLRVNSIASRFHFQESIPRRVRYCVDYQFKIKFGSEYMKLFEDAGWELVYLASGWYIWRKEYEGERPEIYTDVDSLMRRNRRLIAIFAFIGLGQLIALTGSSRSDADVSLLITVAAGVNMVVGLLMIYTVVRLWAYNNQLKVQKH